MNDTVLTFFILHTWIMLVLLGFTLHRTEKLILNAIAESRKN